MLVVSTLNEIKVAQENQPGIGSGNEQKSKMEPPGLRARRIVNFRFRDLRLGYSFSDVWYIKVRKTDNLVPKLSLVCLPCLSTTRETGERAWDEVERRNARRLYEKLSDRTGTRYPTGGSRD